MTTFQRIYTRKTFPALSGEGVGNLFEYSSSNEIQALSAEGAVEVWALT
jgi:hypothetical protein